MAENAGGGMPPMRPEFIDRMERFMKAVNFVPQDRAPIMLTMDSFAGRQAGMTIGEFVRDPVQGVAAQLDMMEYLRADILEHMAYDPRLLGTSWLSHVKLPGIELDDDEIWQVDEKQLMAVEDYDEIIDGGFEPWVQKYYAERLDNLMGKVGPYFGKIPQMVPQLFERGYPCVAMGVNIATPFEFFCGGRSMVKFFGDLRKIPDKVVAAMDVAMEYIEKDAVTAMERNHSTAPWIGGWRTASAFMSREQMEKFVWPYFKKLSLLVIEKGQVPLLHLDADWLRDIDLFLELPAKKCVLELDGATDIRETKKIIGDHMCISGDVPPSMLTLGTPDECYTYARRLIEDMGPGYINSMGCCIPPNARRENVKAMCDASYG